MAGLVVPANHVLHGARKEDVVAQHKADALRDVKLPRDAVREPLFECRWK